MTLRAIVAVAAVLLAPSALAQSKAQEDVEKGLKGTGKYGVAGCGLGSMAFGAQPGA